MENDSPSLAPITSAVNIGSYKGVMLCNRPFHGVSTTLSKTQSSGDSFNNNGTRAFLAGVVPEPLGINVPIHAEPTFHIKRDKKNTALSKHKKWLCELQKERNRLQNALIDQENNESKRKERFSQKAAKFREYVRRDSTEDENDSKTSEDDKKLQASNRPMWALTKESADAKQEKLAEEAADDLIEFANNLDLDQFMDDVEIKARVAQMDQQLSQLQEIVNYEEAKELQEDREAKRLEDIENNGGVKILNGYNLDELNRSHGSSNNKNQNDDEMSIASSVLSECKSIRSVHSIRSVTAIAQRTEAKLVEDQNNEIYRGETPLNPRIVKTDHEDGIRMEIKKLASNLPYIHRNPAI